MITKRWIEVRFQKEGIHAYIRALTDENLADVKFLGHPHRHMFHFRVRIEVNHNERDIEFIQFKRWLEQTMSLNGIDYMSCETIAEILIGQILFKYHNRKVVVEVSEDGENGAVLEAE